MRVLFICQELERWERARSVSYSVQLSLEEGLAAAGAHVTTLTFPCLGRARDLVGNRRFDQVWLHLFPWRFGPDLVSWIADRAPVRLGLSGESLTYSAEEFALIPWLRELEKNYRQWLPALTHLAAVDEADAARGAASGINAAFWPQAVPARCVRDAGPPTMPRAYFSGNPYGARAQWLADGRLTRFLEHTPSPEHGTRDPARFEGLQANVQRYLARPWLPAPRLAVDWYLASLRRLRRRCFDRWLTMLSRAAAVVNLPHYVRGYAGRVVEGMAAGRPVVSWRVPDRPRNEALFEDGREVLLFDEGDPEGLREHLERVIGDAPFAAGLAERARRRVQAHHTTEHRVGQFLRWIRTGEQPTFG